MNYSIKTCLLFIVGLVIFGGCQIKKDATKNVNMTNNKITIEKPITVFIHGTLPPIADKLVRSYDIPQGLTAAQNNKSKVFMGKIPFILAESDPQNFPLSTSYVFGWSGDLNFETRKKEAYDLYYALKSLPLVGPITLIGHSHGCNVALNLAVVVQELSDTSFVIDRLILLAGPVQKETMGYIESPIFKKVYSFYSYTDLIQVLDLQGLYKSQKDKGVPLFSQHTFPGHPKLIQVRVKKGKRGIFHIEFILNDFIKKLPKIITMLDQEITKTNDAEYSANFIVNLKPVVKIISSK